MSAPDTKHDDNLPPDDAAAAETQTAADEAPEMTLEQQLEAALAQRDLKHDHWLRTQAELENYRKRVQKEAEEMRRYQALPLVRDLLPGLDNLHRALDAAAESQNLDQLLEGVRMVVRQFEDFLASRSVVPIEAVGRPFDPNMHEAVGQVPSADHPPMTVIEEIERGYKLLDRVIRPTKVLVSSSPPEQAENQDADEE